MRIFQAVLAVLLLAACGPVVPPQADAPRRILSLDYCADQYVLQFVPRADILALSPDARKRFSYLRAEAAGVRQVRPRTADILTLRPDLVVRSYGGDPGTAAALRRAGVPVLQLGFPSSIEEVRAEVERVGAALGRPGAARRLSANVERRLHRIAASSRIATRPRLLYMTSGGVTSGPGTLVDDIIRAAGFRNFQQRPGWNPIPLERLAYKRPDLVAAAFFDGTANDGGSWSAARHPIARAQLQGLPAITIEGAWTSCGGWFVIDAVEAMAAARGAP